MLFVYTKNPTLTHTPYANDLFTFLSGTVRTFPLRGWSYAIYITMKNFVSFLLGPGLIPTSPCFRRSVKAKTAKKHI